MLDYPNEFMRGVINEQFMVGEIPDASLFSNFEVSEERADDYAELSINWYDNETSLNQLLGQLKENGKKRYDVGVAIFSRIELDRFCKRNMLLKDNVTYERAPELKNDSHGNILLKKEILDKSRKREKAMIAAALAMCFEKVVSETSTT